MTGILNAIFEFLSQLVCWIMTALVLTLNLLLAALGGLIAALAELLPPMPDTPSVPSQITLVADWIAWFFPVGTVIDILVFLLAAWLLMQVVLIVMRWAKATAE